MTEFEQAIANWRDAIGEAKFKKEVTKASISAYGELADKINDYRANDYYNYFQDTSNTIEYKPDGSRRTQRKLNHTARSRQRKSYIRASEWGGNKSEAVIGAKAGEMSMMTIFDIQGGAYMDGRLMYCNVKSSDKHGIFEERFGSRSDAILNNFGAGELPPNIKSLIDKAGSKFWELISERARKDGF